MNDLKFAFRQLLKNPGFTAVAVLTLALGIGANTAIFSIVHAVLLRPLPFKDPDRLVRIWPEMAYPAGALKILREPLRSVEAVAAFTEGPEFNLSRQDEPLRALGSRVSSEFFSVLGIPSALGRTFQPGEDEAGLAGVAVISHSLWRQQFGGDPNIIGSTIQVDGIGREVIGVMPPEFGFPSERTRLWLPLELRPNEPTALWGVSYLRLLGRMRPEVSLGVAQAELDTRKEAVRTGFPWRMPDDWGAAGKVALLHQSLVQGTGSRLGLAFAAVSLVLLIAIANVSNLLLSRGVARQQEWAVRTALGASRRRLLRLELTESLLLGALGGILACVLVLLAHGTLVASLPMNTPRLAEIRFSIEVGGFLFAASVITGLLCGLLASGPLLRSSLMLALRGKERGATQGWHGARVADGIVMGQIALAVALVFSAGLLVKSLWRLAQVDPGFDTQHVLLARVTSDKNALPNPASAETFYSELLQRLRVRPDVTHAELIDLAPLAGTPLKTAFDVEGHPLPEGAARPMAWQHTITPGYPRVVGIPLLRGRAFTEADVQGPGVVLVNRGLAQMFWANDDPIGKRVRPVFSRAWLTVAGVVGDVKQTSLSEAREAEIYFPFGGGSTPNGMTLVVRTAGDPQAIGKEIRALVKALNPRIPVTDVRTMSQAMSASMAVPRWTAQLLSAFAGLGLLLGAIGVHGVVAYAVGRRTREMGIRLALGARPSDLLRMVLRQGIKLGLFGVVFGAGLALVAGRMLRHQLFEVTATDPVTLGIVAALLVATVLLACWLPARRASKIDPMVALRSE